MKKVIIVLFFIVTILIFSQKVDTIIQKKYGSYLYYTKNNKDIIGIYLKDGIFAFTGMLCEDCTIYNLNGDQWQATDFELLGMKHSVFFYKNKKIKLKMTVKYVKNFQKDKGMPLIIYVLYDGNFYYFYGNIGVNKLRFFFNSGRSAFIFNKKHLLMGLLNRKKLGDLLENVLSKLNKNKKIEIDLDGVIKSKFISLQSLFNILKNFKFVNRAWLGISYSIYEDYVKIIKVLPDSPAEKSGLKPGDIIIKINGKTCNVNNLINTINSKKPGDKLQLIIKRNKKIMTIDVILGKTENMNIFYKW